jgi:hypothetical protein
MLVRRSAVALHTDLASTRAAAPRSSPSPRTAPRPARRPSWGGAGSCCRPTWKSTLRCLSRAHPPDPNPILPLTTCPRMPEPGHNETLGADVTGAGRCSGATASPSARCARARASRPDAAGAQVQARDRQGPGQLRIRAAVDQDQLQPADAVPGADRADHVRRLRDLARQRGRALRRVLRAVQRTDALQPAL